MNDWDFDIFGHFLETETQEKLSLLSVEELKQILNKEVKNKMVGALQHRVNSRASSPASLGSILGHF